MVLIAHIVFVGLLLAVVFRKTWGRAVVRFVGKYAVYLGFLVVLASIVGSLFYSNVIGFEACVLCWWQRILLYPMLPLFAVALWRNKRGGGDRSVFAYIAVLAVLATLVAGYHELSNLTGASFLACTDAEGACSKIFVREFGYITIPVMSLTVALYVLLLAWINRIYLSR
jgi:disulfide bond formation protein DsbB